MITITFAGVPMEIFKRPGWTIHTGHPSEPTPTYPTKRGAAEAIAQLAREATRLMRECNEVYRRICFEGQAMLMSFQAWEIGRWNLHKRDVDEVFWWIASHPNTLSPGIYRRLLQLAGYMADMCAIVSEKEKIKYTGTATAMRMLAGQVQDLLSEIDQVWRLSPPAAAAAETSTGKAV